MLRPRVDIDTLEMRDAKIGESRKWENTIKETVYPHSTLTFQWDFKNVKL